MKVNANTAKYIIRGNGVILALGTIWSVYLLFLQKILGWIILIIVFLEFYRFSNELYYGKKKKIIGEKA